MFTIWKLQKRGFRGSPATWVEKRNGRKLGDLPISETIWSSQRLSNVQILKFCLHLQFSATPFFHPGGRGSPKTPFLEFPYRKQNFRSITFRKNVPKIFWSELKKVKYKEFWMIFFSETVWSSDPEIFDLLLTSTRSRKF